MTERNDWIEFLQTQNIIPLKDAESLLAAGQTMVCDLTARGLIAVQGEEAETFLQNQFCNDVRQVTDNLSQLNGYCTAKGRLLALFRLLKRNGSYFCELPRERVEATLKRLQMYVLMSKVTLHDASDALIRIGITGELAGQTLTALFTTLPESVDETVTQNGVTLIRVPGTVPRFLMMGDAPAVKNVWQTLVNNPTDNVKPVDAGLWRHLDILAGIPQVVDETVEEFVPQMLNLQSINALSFKKGCYPGQEVVARMHYLGKQKKRMYLAHLDAVRAPNPGTAIYASGENNEQSIGNVVSSCENPAGGSDILAVLQIASAQTREIHLGDQQKIPFHLKDLPYSVEVEGDGK